jgi:hypothetical protein
MEPQHDFRNSPSTEPKAIGLPPAYAKQVVAR